MAYNTLKGKVNFANSDTGSIESMVDDYSNQTIAGVKTFSSTVSASAFYSTTDGTLLTSSALSSITNDGAGRVIVSDGDGTATAYSNLTYDGTTLTASVSGSAAALHSIPLEPGKVDGQLSASNIYFGDGLQDSSNKLAAQGGDSITVGASGIAVDLATTGGLAHDAGKLKVSPNDATTKGSVSDNDLLIIADSDASNATKKATATVLGTYMQNTLTFTSPGGSDNQVQYRSSGNFAGSSNLTYDGTNTLTTVNITASGHISSSIGFVGDGSGLTNTPAGAPSGDNYNVQFNSGSSFSASSGFNFVYDAPTNVLEVLGDVSSSNDLVCGRDVFLARDVQAGRDVVATGQVSASQNVSASSFYGDGSTLNNIPISNYTANRLIVCGGTTNTIEGVSSLTWNNPLLSVPGNISVTDVSASAISASSTLHAEGAATFSSTVAVTSSVTAAGIYSTGPISGSSTLHAEGDATFSSNLATTGSIVSYGGIRVSGSSYNYTLRDDSGNDMFKADISSNHGRVRVRDQGNTVRVQLDGSGGVISGSGIATIHGLTSNVIASTTTVSASTEVAGQSAKFATLHISGSETEGIRVAKGASDTREIVFENDGADVASIFMNAAETLIIKNESSNDDIQFQTSPGGTARTVMVVDGATPNVGIGTISPLTALDVRYDVTGSLSDDTGGGDVVFFGSGTLTAGKLYFLHTDGAWTETDADAVATGADQMLGIALGANPVVNGVLIRGFFDAATYLSNFSAGKAIYVSTTAASMDTTAPSATGDFVRIVGYCTTTANVIYFNPSSEWIELA